ncbi:MAG TPA: DNRLRE domain-containing protein [Solirubrobacteraceae bacterium]|nr:DNRLRE domain-containing protein [Solirubrobacteraceae bacterium]
MIDRLRSRRQARLAVLAALLGLSALAVSAGLAASLTVSSSKLTSWSSSAGCTPGTVTASADQDTYVDQDAPSSSFGAATQLKVKAPLVSLLGADLGGRRQTLVRFALPAVGLCSVTQAKLRLYVAASSSSMAIEAVRANGPWSETSTWPPPATTGTAISITSGTAAGWREWTVTSQVTAMYSQTNHGFVVRDNVGLSLLAPEQVLNSRTAASNPPELAVTLG